MPPRRSSRSSVTLALALPFALAVAGCDRGQPEQPQAEPANAAAPKPAAGKLDESARGEAAPTLPITGPDGRPTTLAALRGKPLLVNLWATWCGPCIAEMPTLARLAERTPGLQVVLVNQDIEPAADLAPFLERTGATRLPSYRDPENGLGLHYGGNLPLTILYDAEGRELWRMVGGFEWDGDEAAALVARAG